ncbi:hypothetical protein CYMTET_32118 [Cymbomonas tetramitiformis]|uniref:Uncharacterized protein n=1 Tax=Cymbomonas tetramitiformis TaxID=36881 RepID=A0AAE0KS63_9CHLO|nr:hypothetical protein CYMTET_32118 [Cymbomonas tetramitiformis]
MEDELADPKSFVDYLLPRPIRKGLTGAGAAACLVGTVLTVSQITSSGSLGILTRSDFVNLGINIAGFALLLALFIADSDGEAKRVEERRAKKQAQIDAGYRETVTTTTGQSISKLKQVDDDWIIKRLDRWGKTERMPFLGPTKGALLRDLVREKDPQVNTAARRSVTRTQAHACFVLHR